MFLLDAESSKSYRFLDLVSNVIIESRDAEFFENKFVGDTDPELQIIPKEPSENSSSVHKRKLDENVEPRRSQRKRKEKSLGSDFMSPDDIILLVEASREEILNQFSMIYQIEGDLKTFNEAMSSRDVAFWKEAVNDEMDSIMSNNTWILVDLPPGSKPITSKWVFRRKYNTDGSIQTFKARLVAKGFRQKEGRLH